MANNSKQNVLIEAEFYLKIKDSDRFGFMQACRERRLEELNNICECKKGLLGISREITFGYLIESCDRRRTALEKNALVVQKKSSKTKLPKRSGITIEPAKSDDGSHNRSENHDYISSDAGCK
jgi:hypothetical protein